MIIDIQVDFCNKIVLILIYQLNDYFRNKNNRFSKKFIEIIVNNFILIIINCVKSSFIFIERTIKHLFVEKINYFDEWIINKITINRVLQRFDQISFKLRTFLFRSPISLFFSLFSSFEYFVFRTNSILMFNIESIIDHNSFLSKQLFDNKRFISFHQHTNKTNTIVSSINIIEQLNSTI